MTSSPELPVPDEALGAWDWHTYRVSDQDEDKRESIRAIAAPVVAAVLSDIADRMDADGMTGAAGWLRVRAGEYGGAG